MSRYGINYYGSAYYGQPALVDYAITDFTAVPYGHAQIKLNWTSPSGAWNRIRLVRGTYGYPTNPFDGKELLDVYYGFDPGSFLDNFDILSGRFYYYSLFVYDISDYIWVKASDVSALSVKDFKTADLLYKYIPEPYKYTSLVSVLSDETNESLYKYRTFIENTTRKYDLSISNGAVLPILLREFGLKFEPEIGLQQSRVLVRDSVQLYKEKSSNQGIREFIKAFSGYAVPDPDTSLPNPGVNGVVPSHNLMLDYNCSSFEESIGLWENKSNATLSALTTCNITKYQLTSNVLTLTLDKEHGYKVGDQVTVSDSPIPLLNTDTPATLTAVGLTTVSFAKTFYDIGLTKTTGTLSPNPTPWDEPTTINGYPNKQGGILRVSNSNGSTATVSISAAESDPIGSGIPVTAGLAYTFSIYSSGSVSRSVTLSIHWYDRFGVSISTTTGTATPNGINSFSVRPTVTGTAPATAYYAVPVISIASVGNAASGEHHHFDAAQFEQSATVTEFDEARNLHITLKASRINELTNPNFAGSLAPWNILNATSTLETDLPDPEEYIYDVVSYFVQSNLVELNTSIRHEIKVGSIINLDGINALLDGQHTVTVVTENTLTFSLTAPDQSLTNTDATVSKAGSVIKLNAPSTTPVVVESCTGTTNLTPIYYPGSSYTFSIYARAYAIPHTGICKIYWYDADENIIEESIGATTTITTEWSRAYATGTSPENAVDAKVEFTWIPSAPGVDLAIDHALFENTPFVLPYFDGSKGPATDDELYWEGGVANAARSHLYNNRVSIENRLKIALPEFLVSGSTFTIYLAQPKT
jgi:hypothetical protein